jgi:signal transduction histidine kinase
MAQKTKKQLIAELRQAAADHERSRHQLHEAEEKANAYHARLRELASQLTLTEERQRRQLAHDLHDGVGGALALAKLKLDTLADPRTSPDPTALAEVSGLLQQTIEDCHSLTFQLSPPVLYECGLVAAIEWLADRFRRRFALDVSVRAEHGRVPLDEDRRVMLYRAVNELLTNVVKHAGTRSARVTVEQRAEDLAIRVEDEGKGFRCEERDVRDSGCGGFGLFSVRERLAHLGIRCEISTAPGCGTRVSLTTPLAR